MLYRRYRNKLKDAVARRVMHRNKRDKQIAYNTPMEMIIKLAPLSPIVVYCGGFLIFVLNFIYIGAMNSKTNFFTYMQINDHAGIFGIGIVFFTITLFLFAFPSFVIYQAMQIREYKWMVIVGFIIAMLACIPLGAIFSYLTVISLYSFGKKLNLSPNVLSTFKSLIESNSTLVIAIGYLLLLAINLSLARFLNIYGYKKFMRAILVVFLIALILFPSAVIHFSGYGNYWACLALTPSECQFLKENPEFSALIECDNSEFGYTIEQVFIPLQLRDYVFIARMQKDDAKVEAIEIIPKKEARIFHVTPNRENCNPCKDKKA